MVYRTRHTAYRDSISSTSSSEVETNSSDQQSDGEVHLTEMAASNANENVVVATVETATQVAAFN